MTLKTAIWTALDELDHKSSVREVQKLAQQHAGGDLPTYAYVVIVRLAWRKAKGVTGDNRTYRGQPRRNQLNDSTTNLPQVRRLNSFLNGPVTAERLTWLFGSDSRTPFHSIDQIVNALNELQELRAA